MKKSLILILIIPFFLFAIEEQTIISEFSLTSETTLSELAVQSQIPIKKMKYCLNLGNDIENNATLGDLKIGKEEIEKAFSEYEDIKARYISSITIIGMLIVFLSLFIIGFIINLLKHLDVIEKFKERKILIKKSKTYLADINIQLSNNVIVAAITTVFLHEMDVEEQNKMILTWKKTPISMWKVSRILPNQEFYKQRGNK